MYGSVRMQIVTTLVLDNVECSNDVISNTQMERELVVLAGEVEQGRLSLFLLA